MLGHKPAVQIVFFVFCSIAVVRMHASSLPSVPEESNPFIVFFNQLATAQGVGGSRGEAAYIRLTNSLEVMTSAEIAAGIPVIDYQLDNTGEPEDRLAKYDAANLLMFISWRSDGATLLASQIDRLTSMLNDPSHFLSGQAAIALQHIGISRPDLVIPILEAALKITEANNTTGVGPGIAVILLRMTHPSERISQDIVQYMNRTDLTDDQLLSTVIGIDSSPIIPDVLTAELVRCLDRPNEHIKTRALIGIAKSNPTARSVAQRRIQSLANDPRETSHVRRLAAEALKGEITEDPDSGK